MGTRRAFLLMMIPWPANCFADMDLSILLPGAVVQNACVFENTGVYADTFTMVPVYEDTVFTCNRGYFLPKESETCVLCLPDAWCPGGEYTYSVEGDTGINVCPPGTFAPAGMWDAVQCGRKFHVGDAFLYLRAGKATSPALHFDVNGDGVADMYANMTTYDVPMNSNTERKLKVRIGDTVYSVYDDTVIIPQTKEE